MKAKKKAPTGWEKYRNPDKRCAYPWGPGGAGYCWSFANHVDGDKKFKDLSTICPGCEMWKEKKVLAPGHGFNSERKTERG
jgi:hypothetical protein